MTREIHTTHGAMGNALEREQALLVLFEEVRAHFRWAQTCSDLEWADGAETLKFIDQWMARAAVVFPPTD